MVLEENKDNIQEIYEEIKSRIINQEYTAETKLNQINIANELGVSRTPVIKALYMLQSQRLVDNIPNKGFYVHKVSLTEMVELYKLRQAIEMVAVVDVAEIAPVEELVKLKSIFEPFIDQPTIDVAAYAKSDQMFHDRLVELSNNSILQHTNQSILILPKAYTAGLLRSPKETLPEHLDLVEALMNRDAEAAQLISKKHIDLSLIPIKIALQGLLKIGIDPQKITIDDISLDSRIAVSK